MGIRRDNKAGTRQDNKVGIRQDNNKVGDPKQDDKGVGDLRRNNKKAVVPSTGVRKRVRRLSSRAFFLVARLFCFLIFLSLMSVIG